MKTPILNKYNYTTISNDRNNIYILSSWDHTLWWEVEFDYFWGSIKWSSHKTLTQEESILMIFKNYNISKWYLINPIFWCVVIIRTFRLINPIKDD